MVEVVAKTDRPWLMKACALAVKRGIHVSSVGWLRNKNHNHVRINPKDGCFSLALGGGKNRSVIRIPVDFFVSYVTWGPGEAGTALIFVNGNNLDFRPRNLARANHDPIAIKREMEQAIATAEKILSKLQTLDTKA